MDEEEQQVDGVITGTRNLIPLLKMESYQITMRMKEVTREREWQTGESHLPREEGVSGLETVRLGGKELGGEMMGGGVDTRRIKPGAQAGEEELQLTMEMEKKVRDGVKALVHGEIVVGWEGLPTDIMREGGEGGENLLHPLPSLYLLPLNTCVITKNTWRVSHT